MQESDFPESEPWIVHIDKDLEDLIPGYLENRRQDISVMQAALAEGDFETIRIRGHSMKGSGGGYGFETITEIGKSLERAALEGNSGAVSREMEKLSNYVDLVKVVYE